MHITSTDITCRGVNTGGDVDVSRPYSLSFDKMVWDPNYNQKINYLSGCPTSTSQHNATASSKTKTPSPAAHGAGPYHNQLHASLQAFKARKWRPLSPDTIQRPTVTRCRPISGKDRPSSAVPALIPHPPSQQRPGTAPTPCTSHSLTVYPHRPDTPRVHPGNFDTLSPRILSHLVTDPRPLTPNSTYGDVIFPLKGKGKSKKSKWRNKKEEDIFNDASSDVNEDDEEDVEDDDDSDDESSLGSDDSENEKDFGSNFANRRKIPENLQLRPDKLDHVYTQPHKRDMTRFNFDAEDTPIPPYEFECPIPYDFKRINFRLHARESTNWRFASAQPEDPQLCVMFDRLVELEKRQIETEEWEEKRMKGYWRKRAPPRDTGSATYRPRDKRCCSSCLQACCVGDCPNKKQTQHLVCCETCHQPFCVGSCVETKYEQRMRQPRETHITSLPPRQPIPKNCRPCQKRHNAKLINANHVVLGRPKSAFSTYSRGKKSSKPKDLRPKSALEIERTISEKIEQLGIEPVQPPPSPKPSRPSSRNGIIPGKTYFSNLSRSLTDLTGKRRCKSAKIRRPRSRTSTRVKSSIEIH